MISKAHLALVGLLLVGCSPEEEARWEFITSIPNERASAGFGYEVAAVDERLYLAREANTREDQLFLSVSLRTRSVREEQLMPRDADNFLAAGFGGSLMAHQGELYSFGSHAQVYRDGEWRPIANYRNHARGEASYASYRGQIWSLGGRADVDYGSSVQTYSGGEEGVWSVLEDLPFPTGRGAALPIGDRLFVLAAGLTPSGRRAYFDGERWNELADGEPATQVRAVALGESIYIAENSRVRLYDPFADTVSDIEAPGLLSEARVAVARDSVYLVGQEGVDISIHRLLDTPVTQNIED